MSYSHTEPPAPVLILECDGQYSNFTVVWNVMLHFSQTDYNIYSLPDPPPTPSPCI